MMWLPYHRSPSFARKRKQRVQEEEFPSWLMPQPDTTHIGGENVHINGLEIGHSSIQGYRQSMEDQHIITKLSLANHTLVAILDGHAGEFAAKFAASMLAKHIERTKSWKDYCAQSVSARSDATGFLSSALVSAYMSIDEEMKELDLEVTSGSTLVCSIITPSHIITANVGDSRCVIGCSNRTVIDMTEDHKPSLKEEKARIVAAGGFVMMDRVNGELAMSRALGDFQYKLNDELDVTMQMVTCVPDIAGTGGEVGFLYAMYATYEMYYLPSICLCIFVCFTFVCLHLYM
jgi:serine/threonine protein phosphatase PrpC